MSRIVFLHNRYGHNARGGAERVVQTLVERMIDRGETPTVITIEVYHGLASFIPHHHKEDPSSIMRIASLSRGWRGVQRSLWQRILLLLLDCCNVFSAIALWQWLRHHATKIVWTHNVRGMGLPIAVALACGRAHWRWIHTLHDLQLIVPSGVRRIGQEDHWGASGMLQRWYTLFTRLLMGSPWLVTAPTRWIMEEHQSRGFFPGSRTMVLPNVARKDVRERPTIQKPSQKRDIILVMGQLEEHRGILEALAALDELRASTATQHPWVAHIIGQGSLEAMVRQWVGLRSSWARFDEKRSDEALLPLWQQTLFALVPSACYENAPTTIVEALEIGVPVLAPAIGGIPELIEGHPHSQVYDPLASTLTLAIESMLQCALKMNSHEHTPHPHARLHQALVNALIHDVVAFARYNALSPQ